MPRAKTRAESRARIEALCADRARGLVFTEIARRHGVSRAFAHWAARHVQVGYYWNPWHVARYCRPDQPPAGYWTQLHEIRGGRWAG